MLCSAVEGSDSLPFIGIGDALHALPPWSGMSGNYALKDASDLATALLAEQKKGRESWCLASMARENERKFLERADKMRKGCMETPAIVDTESTPHSKFRFLPTLTGKICC